MENKWTIAGNKMLTPWADDVDPKRPLPEYPRPQMVRNGWQNLNGLWEYAIIDIDSEKPDDYQGDILVPFCIESALSGVGKPLQPTEKLWYRRFFEIPSDYKNNRIILHFGAVDWKATVFINGSCAGEHVGGYTPFCFDITDYLNDGRNELVLSVIDPTDGHWQQKGKQVLKPATMYYTAVSGIWQTVWLEPVNDEYIKKVKLTPDIDRSNLNVAIDATVTGDFSINARVLSDGAEVVSAVGEKLNFDIHIDNPILWSPDNPHLYDLQISISKNKNIVDTVTSYFGMRKFSIVRDDKGIKRFALNNEILFLNGPLDQGYWPDGLYTAPTDEALKFDIDVTKKAGFNMTRKHIKIEPARWYYWCDKLGLIVWQDMVNGGKMNVNLTKMRLMVLFQKTHYGKLFASDTSQSSYRRSWREDKESRADFERELKEYIDTLYNAASIGVWVLFNESWGQYDSVRIGKWLKEYDPTRLVDNTSGWIDQGSGDFHSNHIYVRKMTTPIWNKDRALVISEYGGFKLKVNDHMWSTEEYGYRSTYKTHDDFIAAYKSLIENEVLPMKKNGVCAVVYTQLTDVEIEINGLFTYDRKVCKMPIDTLYKINTLLLKKK